MINSINDIIDLVVSGEQNWSQYGCVKVVEQDDLLLFNYTNEAQYSNNWNAFERLSRGLIINLDGEVIARPFEKFFNYGQVVNNALCVPHDKSHLVNVFEKLDGSLGILYRQDGYHKIATRGSFDSEQAQRATAYLNKFFYVDEIPSNWTLLFEIIYPENRIVVDYGNDERLVLLGIVNRLTGEELPFYPTVYEFGNYMGFDLPKVFEFNNPTEVLESAARLIGTQQEGYVLFYNDGSRFKIKGDDYLFLHRIISNISKKNVFEMWLNNNDLPDIPDEFIDQIEVWYDEFDGIRDAIYQQCVVVYESAPKEMKKDFALFVKDNKYSSVLFAMYDDNASLLESALNKCVKNEVLY